MTVKIAQSQALYTSIARRDKSHNATLLTVGLVDIDIPQHPGVLHGVVSRSSKRLSSTLQEFIRPGPKRYARLVSSYPRLKITAWTEPTCDVFVKHTGLVHVYVIAVFSCEYRQCCVFRGIDATDSNITAVTATSNQPPQTDSEFSQLPQEIPQVLTACSPPAASAANSFYS